MVPSYHQNLTIVFERPFPKPEMGNGRIHKVPHIAGYYKHIADRFITVILDRDSKARPCIRFNSSISLVRLSNFVFYYPCNYYHSDKVMGNPGK